MYFRGHGGATVDDLAWWCGLAKTLCKEAVSLIEKELEKVEYEGKIYYHFPVPITREDEAIHVSDTQSTGSLRPKGTSNASQRGATSR